MTRPLPVLIIEGRFYPDIADELLRGAKAALEEEDVACEVVSVPGALEVPQAFAAAIGAGLFGGQRVDAARGTVYSGCVALGCVIRGETSHYDIVANESTRALMQLAVEHAIPVGNGVLTVENRDQALARARVDGKNKGRGAALACLALVRLKRAFHRHDPASV